YRDNERAARRFLWEAEVTSRLNHPGIPAVHGAGRTDDGRPCYAMRYIRGETLQAAARAARDPAGGRWDREQLLRRFAAACYAVACAHSRGVVPRDLKPGNIMLGGYDETLVIDWGLARPIGGGGAAPADAGPEPPIDRDEAMTRAGEAPGTPAYMSPEQ